MGGSITSYFTEEEGSKEAIGKLRGLSDTLHEPNLFYVLDLDTTQHLLQYCKGIDFRQTVVDDNNEGRALSLLLTSLLYHSQALGLTSTPVGTSLRPFKLDGLIFPRMSRARPTTQSVIYSIDFNAAVSSRVLPVDIKYLSSFPTSHPVSLWGRVDHYLSFLERAAREIAAVVHSHGFPEPVHLQVKDLNGTLDKLIYRSKKGSDLLRCRVFDVDRLKAILESPSLKFQCVEDASNALGDRVLKVYRTVHYHHLEEVPVWIEIGQTSSQQDQSFDKDRARHLSYEVERMVASYDAEQLQELGTVQSMAVDIVPFQRFQETKGVVQSNVRRQMDMQQAMLAGKYGGTCN